MGLKRQLLDAVKAGYPDFNEETDEFSIQFSGGGDSFGSFYTFDIWKGGWGMKNAMEGSFDLNEHSKLLYNIIEASGVDYNWNDGGTQGKIEYNAENRTLTVETQLLYESWVEFEDED